VANHLLQMPGDCLALTVGIGRQPNLIGITCQRLQLGNGLAAALASDVLRPVIRRCNAHLARWQVADVPVGGGDHPAATEVMLDFVDLVGGFDDEEFGHGTRFGIINNLFGVMLEAVYNSSKYLKKRKTAG